MRENSCLDTSSLLQRDSIEKPLKLYCDNELAVFYAHNNKSSGAAKHIDIKFYVVKEQVQDQTICLEHIRTNKMLADPLTKGLPHNVFREHLAAHGFKGKPMISGQRGPKNKTLFQTGKVIVVVNLTVITVMTRHALYTNL